MRPEGARVGDEVGVAQVGADDATGVVALLVHADRAVHRVVDHEHDDGELLLHRGRELLAGHQEVAVAGDADDRAVGVHRLGGDRGRDAVAHRAAARAQLRRVAVELVVAVRPHAEVAGAVGEDRLGGQALAQRRHHRRHLQRPGQLARLERGCARTRRAPPRAGRRARPRPPVAARGRRRRRPRGRRRSPARSGTRRRSRRGRGARGPGAGSARRGARACSPRSGSRPGARRWPAARRPRGCAWPAPGPCASPAWPA